MPGVVLGHNARIAWGATNIDPDVQDLVIEKVDPADPSAYLHDGASVPFDGPPRADQGSAARTPFDLEIRSTVHGPILNDVDDRLTDAPPMAIRWTANLEPDRTFEAILGLNTAASFAGLPCGRWRCTARPAQNFVYADVDGHIGYQFPGYVPIRSNPDDRGDRPVRGDDGSGEWTGRDPVRRPALAVRSRRTASSSPPTTPQSTANYPHFVAQEWDPGFRAERILDLIDAVRRRMA